MVTDKAKWIGYSKGKAYPVFKRYEGNDEGDDKIGLTEIEGWLYRGWCTFEKIVENTE